jgi:Flp pilus assembly protein CpaB
MLRRSPRALLLWGAAVVVAIATAAVVASDLAALHRRANDLGAERPAVIARHDLPVGAIVDDSDVRERRVHTSQLPPGVLGAPGDAVGRVVRVPVLRDGFVARGNLAPRHRTGLDGAVPSGMRAMRFVVTDAVEPRSGAAVDVLASFESGATSESTASATATATVVARGVLVLRVDRARTADGAAGLGITVLVTPREARDLAFASTHGVVTLALVPPEEARSP